MANNNAVIKWRKEDEKNLRKAINEFNKKVRKLQKTRKDKSYLPDELDFEASKDLIKTRSELNRVLRSLGRFKGKEAYKKVTLPSGDSLTNWEKKELQYQKATAIRRINKRMAELKALRPEYRMGNEEYRTLESVKNSILSFGKKKPSKRLSSRERKKRFEEAKARIENWGSSDLEVRQAFIYRQNYFTMLSKTYSNLEGYDVLVKYLQSIENPVKFYELIKALEQGEKFKDISYMYDATPYQRTLNLYLESLGLNKNTVEYETKVGE